MTAYTDAYAGLNSAQKQAVDTIEGPLLVIAGPGTGKTQLLSARVANIMLRTDTPAHNILCLTFTQSGADNMRERLTRFVGRQAYDVGISTYHAFGSDLIARYPEYFPGTRLQSAVDDLGKREIVLGIVDALSFKNPLKQTQHHIGDLLSTISEIKRALLSSDDLRALAAENTAFISTVAAPLQEATAGFTRMPSKLAAARPYFADILRIVRQAAPADAASARFEPLAVLCAAELESALEAADAAGKTGPLTAWKNSWLAKNADNQFIVAGELENRRLQALADVLDAYGAALAAQGLYDFDDMILRTIAALETNDDFRYTIQERYLYLLLDEFQDTNAAQLRLVQLLTDNPVHEGRPNVMAVGDDDQAIYAFQGAQYSNMLQFHQLYRDTMVVNLSENYRSHADILSAAAQVAGQIQERLTGHFSGLTKQLTAANMSITESAIERREFQSDIAERAWIAEQIRGLIDAGTPASEIAVLAPKHKYLEPLVPYLNSRGVPVRYEKRENILEAPVVRQLITMSRLLVAIATDEQATASALWPQVLSYDFWRIPTKMIWELSWQISDSQKTTDKLSWNQALLHAPDEQMQLAADVILATAARIATETAETILDDLIGTSDMPVQSPLREYYTSAAVQAAHPDIFYETLSHLTVLRRRLSEYQDRSDSALMITDFLRFVGLYQQAEQPMIDTSPYSQQADSVQLLTVFKAKGLEYQHVFLVSCLDDVWGSSSRGNSNKLTLPANLKPIRHAGATDDERLRILFVALTRARRGLTLTSSTRTYSGAATKRLKYFDERDDDTGTGADTGATYAMILPEHARRVIADSSDAIGVELLELDWHTRHTQGVVQPDLRSLLSDRTTSYRISPTHVVSYIDLEYAGPQDVYFRNLLRFPAAPSIDSQFGSAIHETLEWYQQRVNELGHIPELSDVLTQFERRMRSRKLSEQRALLEIERGQHMLPAYLKARSHIFRPGDVAERDFYGEQVMYDDVSMTGRIDRMEVNTASRTITVVDYKTGKSYSSWKRDTKLHRYRLQLYLYKLLIEGSRTYRGYTVTSGRLEFIQPDDNGQIHTLELKFDDAELIRTRNLLAAVWKRLRDLDFPDTSGYQPNLAGMMQFEQDLIDGTI